MADLLFDQATKYLCRTYPQRQGDRQRPAERGGRALSGEPDDRT